MVRKLKFDFNECLKKGLLRRIPKSVQKANSSLKAANKWIEEADKNLASDSLNSCLISCYMAMFHSARAILFKDGFREKSHACIARFLEGKYVNKGLLKKEFVGLLDHHRELRHQDQYSFQFSITQDECKNALETADKFLAEMKKLLK
ncbi:MAG: HEPN domain-containing protein [Candidatus Aminicenantes bacterium]|nr:HEPN domain-containing protein [Candidatus Aminicenantes bacterium]